MQTANIQYIRVLDRVPAELWLKIFESMTPVPSNYQFDLERAACTLANEDYRLEHKYLTILEETQAIQYRLAVVQVCRYWYEVGIQALWSHLSLRITERILEILSGIRHAIERRPALAASVIQVSLQNEHLTLRNQKFISSHLEKIIPQLNSLKIIICPQVYGRYMARPSLDVVVLHQDFVTDNKLAMTDIRNYFTTVRVLDVDLSMRCPARADSSGDVLFPRLERLAISSSIQNTIKCISSQWQIPRLQKLSICSHLSLEWINFIERCGSTLQVLRFAGKYHILNVRIPALKELHVSDCNFNSWRITAPRLERFDMFDIDVHHPILRQHLRQVVKHAQNSFPNLRTVHLRSFQRKQIVTKNAGLIDLDITSWKEAGLDVNIHSSLMQVSQSFQSLG
jgi:hypothetical protein